MQKVRSISIDGEMGSRTLEIDLIVGANRLTRSKRIGFSLTIHTIKADLKAEARFDYSEADVSFFGAESRLLQVRLMSPLLCQSKNKNPTLISDSSISRGTSNNRINSY